jgi:hypothetical protein
MENNARMKSTLQTFVFCLTAMFLLTTNAANAEQPELQYYEVRIYKIYDFEKQQIADDYLRDALLPALNRQNIKNVGAFHNLKDENDHSIYVVIPFASLESFSKYNQKLAADTKYQEAGKQYLDRKKGDGIFDRIESRLLKAFKSIPQMELADFSKDKVDGRIFELRLYESHTEEHARRKVKMFDSGETQLMRDVNLGPVFFGETLAGPDLPNLVYMLAAENLPQHEAHWEAFLKSDGWKNMKNLPEYKDTVSKIKNWFLKPTSYSQF